jgi:NADH-quinone oxidoreductase subunit N
MSFEVLSSLGYLATSSLALLLFGVHGNFRDKTPSQLPVLFSLSAGALILTAMLLLDFGQELTFPLGDSNLILDPFGKKASLLILLGGAVYLFTSSSFWSFPRTKKEKRTVEPPLLVMLGILGMILLLNSQHILLSFLCLEMQSLAMYTLAGSHSHSSFGTEAGLKYFFLGALASTFFIYGMSMSYGAIGSMKYMDIESFLTGCETNVYGIQLGMAGLMAGFLFKLGIVPFHQWVPDIQEGADTETAFFFAIVPKVALAIALIRLVDMYLSSPMANFSQVVLGALAFASILWGSVAALRQRSIKRLLGYSAIGHGGYSLLSTSCGTPEGFQSTLFYWVIYVPTSIYLWLLILAQPVRNRFNFDINMLTRKPALGMGAALMLFSLAGIPPLGGFFAKWWILEATVGVGLYSLAVSVVLVAVIGAFYYLRLIQATCLEQTSAWEKREFCGKDKAVIMGISLAWILLSGFLAL